MVRHRPTIEALAQRTFAGVGASFPSISSQNDAVRPADDPASNLKVDAGELLVVQHGEMIFWAQDVTPVELLLASSIGGCTGRSHDVVSWQRRKGHSHNSRLFSHSTIR